MAIGPTEAQASAVVVEVAATVAMEAWKARERRKAGQEVEAEGSQPDEVAAHRNALDVVSSAHGRSL